MTDLHPEIAYTDPWDRQPEETDKAWEAFRTYRDIGYGRTLKKAAEAQGITPAAIYTWAKKNNWHERIQAWDIYEDRIFQAERAQQLKDMGAKHAKVTQDAMQAIMAPIYAILQKAEDPDFAAQLLEYDFAELLEYAQRSSRIIDRLMKAERLSLDAPTEITSTSTQSTHTVKHELEEDQLEELADLFNKHILPQFSGEAEDSEIVDAEVIEIQQD